MSQTDIKQEKLPAYDLKPGKTKQNDRGKRTVKCRGEMNRVMCHQTSNTLKVSGRDLIRYRMQVLTGGTSLSLFLGARVEDHDDIMRLFERQTSLPQHSQLAERPFFLAELVEAQDEENQTAVCEVGFTSAQKHTRRIPSGSRSD